MPIIARITVDGKISQFSTKLEVNPELWSVKLGRASTKHNEDAKQLVRVTKSAATYQKYEVTRKHFIESKYIKFPIFHSRI